MRRNKSGISLIVLVITIIVMIILAAAVVIALDNSGIINKANEAVDENNLKQVQHLASLIWADAYLDETITTDEQYDEYVKGKLEENNIKLQNYYIDVTANGVTVEGPDTTKPTVTIVADKQSITTGETITFVVTFNDNKAIGEVNLTTDDIILNGFTATKAITGEGNTRTITLSNVQGETGEKSITIKTGVAKDSSGNESEETTSTKLKITQTLGALITRAEKYGTKVNYEANGVTDWKVFYKQTVGTEEYVYLIASEALAYDKVPTILQTTYGATITEATVTLGTNDTRTVGQIYWNGTTAGANVSLDTKEKWMAGWSDYGKYENVRRVSYFLDENIWSSFNNTIKYKDTNGESYVKGAIGTPTAEMFVASWNEKREIAVAKGDTTTYDKKLELLANGTTGYYVNDITNGEATSNANSQSISTSDSLYIWTTRGNSSVWLASPSGNSIYNWLYASDGGYGYHIGKGVGASGARPVVCLRADIPATTDADGNFVI